MTVVDRAGNVPRARARVRAQTAAGADEELVALCPVGRLTADRGVAALVETTAVALFLLSSGELYAIDNVDPWSGASVLSRGIVGDAGGVPTVASPLYKQRFDLRTGVCLEDPDVAVGTHVAVLLDGVVHVRLRR